LRRFAIVLLLFMLVRSLPAQTPALSSIRGTLVRWGTADPVASATIELRGASNPDGAPIAITATRASGEFVFPSVPTGTYRIVAIGAGFATAEYGQLRPNGDGRPLTLARGEETRVTMGIIPGGVISGTVTDQDGQPMVYASVTVMKVAYDAEGQMTTTTALEAKTNDLGEYRAFWLPPGQYVVNGGRSRLNTFGNQGMVNPRGSDMSIPSMMVTNSARPRASAPPVEEPSPEARISGIGSMYYPNVPDVRGAELIEVREGSEVSNINIRFTSASRPAGAVALRGVVVEPSGAPVQGNFSVSISTWPLATPTPFATVRMQTTRVPAMDPAQAARGAQIYVADNGKFDGAAARGVYQIRATRGEMSGRVIIDAGSGDLDVKIPLVPPTTVSGRVSIVGGGTANLSGLRVTLRTAPNIQLTSPVAADGQFRVEGVIPGDYQVSLPLTGILQNAYVKSIPETALRVEGTEPVPPLEIGISLGAASLKGRVLNARQGPVTQATVVVLPPGRPPFRSDRVAVFTTNASGQFEFRGLPPGEYRVFAWEDVDPGAWFNASFVGAYERDATALTLSEGQSRELELRVIPATR
jgi:hypothetical protein